MNPETISNKIGQYAARYTKKTITIGEERKQRRQEHGLPLNASTNTEAYHWCEHTAFPSHASQPQLQHSAASSKSKRWDKAKKTKGSIAAAELVASWEVSVLKVSVQDTASTSSS